MAVINFKSAVGRVSFDGGVTEDGKLIRKSKTYSNIAEDVDANGLNAGLEALASLSALPYMGAEKVETSSIHN